MIFCELINVLKVLVNYFGVYVLNNSNKYTEINYFFKVIIRVIGKFK